MVQKVYMHSGCGLLSVNRNSNFSRFWSTGFHQAAWNVHPDAMDFISNSVPMPIVAVLTCIFVGFVIKPKTIIDEVESSDGGTFKSKKMFTVMIKWIAPIFLIAILISSILNALGIITM